MDCKVYRRLYPKYSDLPISRETSESPEYADYCEHFHDCRSCSDWTLAQCVEKRGAKVKDYPCVHIAYHVTAKLDSPLADPFNDPDVIVWQCERSGEYGIPVRDGGASVIVIRYCPWCGAPLREAG